MKYSICIVLFFVVTMALSAETIIPPGPVQGVWNEAGSPYRITGNLSIATGTTLQLDEGVEVIFEGTFRINVSGRILSLGSQANPVSITAQDTLNGWSGIRIQDTGGTGNLPSRFEYTQFSYGKAMWGATGSDPLNFGGAIWASNAGVLSFEYCTFYRCKSIQDGSVIYAQNNTTIIMDNCIVKSCESGFFGGVFVKNGGANISNTLFEGNIATTFGAGIYLYECTPANVISCKLIDNSAGAVTGIYCFDSPLKVINCLFAGNSTTMGLGGGIGAIYGTLTVTNCTFYQNHSAIGGGAIWVNSLSSAAQITNSIFWANTPTPVASTSSSYVLQYCSLQAAEGNDTNIVGDPLFEDVPYSFVLSDNSPCIDAGSPDTEDLMLPEFDLDGNPRLADGNGDGTATIDIGCYEWQPSNVGILTGLVLDATSQSPIVGALIIVGGQNLESDADGIFSIELEAGLYELSCIATGFQDVVMTDIEVLAGQTLLITIIMEGASGVEDHTPNIAQKLAAFPNPFTRNTELRWAKSAKRIEIFNIRGQRIRLFTGSAVPITNKLNWDGLDHSGKSVPTGVYYARVSFESGSATTKLLLIK